MFLAITVVMGFIHYVVLKRASIIKMIKFDPSLTVRFLNKIVLSDVALRTL